MKIILETDRLILREINLEDTQDMLRLHSIPEVQKYTGDPLVESEEKMAAIIETRIKNYEKYGYGRWATILKNTNQFIGWSGLAYLEEIDEIDVGYRFLPEYWGKGLATEATIAILNYAYEDLKLKKIIALAMKENIASIRVMEKSGMTFDKIAPFEACGGEVVWYTSNREQFLTAKQKNT